MQWVAISFSRGTSGPRDRNHYFYALNTTPTLIYKCIFEKLDGLSRVPSFGVGIRSQIFTWERIYYDVVKFFSKILLCDLFFHILSLFLLIKTNHPLEVGDGKVVFYG